MEGTVTTNNKTKQEPPNPKPNPQNLLPFTENKQKKKVWKDKNGKSNSTNCGILETVFKQ